MVFLGLLLRQGDAQNGEKERKSMFSMAWKCDILKTNKEDAMEYLFLTLYAADVAVHLYACVPPVKDSLRCATKCMLMPLLAIVYLCVAEARSPLVMGALLCGFLGDAFLIMDNKSWAFIAGLLSFAAGHALYILYMFGSVQAPQYTLVLLLVAVAYLCGIAATLRMLWPTMPKKLFAPFLFYMLMISAMSLSALRLALVYRSAFGWMAYAGSLLFLLSDSVLAYGALRRRLRYGSLIVMTTYIMAQTLLAAGLAFVGAK